MAKGAVSRGAGRPIGGSPGKGIGKMTHTKPAGSKPPVSKMLFRKKSPATGQSPAKTDFHRDGGLKADRPESSGTTVQEDRTSRRSCCLGCALPVLALPVLLAALAVTQVF